MRILILNRRCPKHPQRGGAEIYTFYMAQALLKQGHLVEWFSSHYRGLPKLEVCDGIRFIRRGTEFSTHFWGLYYAIATKPDVVIDEFNGIGFFTFFLKNSLVIVHQLYQEFWNAEFGILGSIFKVIERFLLRLYKNRPVVTVSNSTRKNLQNLGFRKIRVILNGLDVSPLSNMPTKNDFLTITFLGRLRKTKNPEDAIRAFVLLKNAYKNATMYVMGKGPLFNQLFQKYGNIVNFLGFVEEDKKYEVLKKSHFLFVPSIREGWGQVVIQANAMATPAIGFNVPGLRDSILHGSTGFLVKDYKEMAYKAYEVYNSRAYYYTICRNALDFSKKFSWQKAQQEFVNFFNELTF